jgi:hypothetical protein
MKKRLSKETTERIEGCGITIDTQLNLEGSITDALGSMIEEGWEYEDVKDYLFDLIDDIIETQERQDDKEAIARIATIGRKVVIIDETKTQNNITIKTVSDFRLKNRVICFEEDEYGIYFSSADMIEQFLENRKTYIHDGEVSMQLVN